MIPRSTSAILVVFSTIFLALHLPFLPSEPASIDSVNFLLGLDDFSVVEHRPHPPGAPVYIALGKVSHALFVRILPGQPVQAGVWALAIWGVFLGAFAAVALFIFFRGLESNDGRATAATALTLTCPVFWFSASRPMSDVPGLVAGLTGQALVVAAFGCCRGERKRLQPLLLAAALMSGIAIGFRVQNALLTLPLLIFVLWHARLSRRDLAGVVLAFSIGVAGWLIPLIVASGGPVAYSRALSAQGSQDFGGADILATNLTIRRSVQELIYTFAYPWADSVLAGAVLAFSFVGTAVMLARARSGVVLLALGAVPYAAFHLLFQENAQTRYALPLVSTVAYLAIRGMDTLTARVMPLVVAGLSLAGMALALPSAVIDARTPNPVFEAISDVRDAASRQTVAPVLAMHYGVTRMLRGQDLPVRMLPTPAPDHEWLSLVRHWQQSPDTPLWFLAEGGRADFALIDPRSWRLLQSYPWSFPRKFVM